MIIDNTNTQFFYLFYSLGLETLTNTNYVIDVMVLELKY